ncbi:MAG: PspA/IM30 family protein [Verrucomicrobiota bacterium]
MKLLSALSNVFRRIDEDAANALANPLRDGAMAIEDAQKQVDAFTRQIHELMTNTGMLQKQLSNAQSEVAKFDGFARRAAAAGNRDDVTEAVAAKQRAQATLDTLTNNVAANKSLEAKLRMQLADARSRIATAEMNKARLAANIGGNKLRGSLAQASVEFSSKNKGLAALDNLEKAAQKEEASANAWQELAGDTPGARAASLDDKYGGASASVNDEVERLMAGTPPQPGQRLIGN